VRRASELAEAGFWKSVPGWETLQTMWNVVPDLSGRPGCWPRNCIFPGCPWGSGRV